MRAHAPDPAIVTDDCSIASIRHVFASHERLFKYYKNVNNNINKQYSQNAKIGFFTITLDCVIFDYYNLYQHGKFRLPAKLKPNYINCNNFKRN